MNRFMISVTRFVAPILIASILVSCSASQHSGMTYKKRPLMTEKNENVWFEYWEDQFDARGGRVIAPSMQYPQVAHNAYGRALQEWNMKASDASTKTVLTIVGGILGFTLLIYLIAVASVASAAGSGNI